MRSIIVILLLALTTGTIAAKQPPVPKNLLFILDASGSMWGRIDGTPKISVAKQVMSRLVGELPSGAKAGLMAYGHRRKGDCTDIQSLVGLGPLDRDTLIARIKGLNPKGKTPITAAVNKAVAELREVEESATVILVSDGLESCGGDPCAAVKAAQQAGVNFKLDVVGFDLGDADSSQLQCMAKAGGGQFFTAANASELSKALKTVSAPPAPTKTDVVFKATDGKDGPVITSGLRWTLVHADTGQPAIKDFDVATLTMAVTPGPYTVEVERDKDGATTNKKVRVKAGQRLTAKLPIVVELPDATVSGPASGPAGSTAAITWTGPDEASDTIAVVEPGGGADDHLTYTYTHDGSPLKLTLPPKPGDYELLYVQHQGNKVLTRQSIRVTQNP